MSDALKRLLAERAKRIESEEKKDDGGIPTGANLVCDPVDNSSSGSSDSKCSETQGNESVLCVSDTSSVVSEPSDKLTETNVTQVPTPSTHPLKAEMAALEQALNNEVPDFANKLREIHIKLRKDPHTVTLLSDEEIGLIVSGMEKHVNVQIVAPAAKKASSRKNLLANVSASDL